MSKNTPGPKTTRPGGDQSLGSDRVNRGERGNDSVTDRSGRLGPVAEKEYSCRRIEEASYHSFFFRYFSFGTIHTFQYLRVFCEQTWLELIAIKWDVILLKILWENSRDTADIKCSSENRCR